MNLSLHFIVVPWPPRPRLAAVALAVGLLAVSSRQALGAPEAPPPRRLVVEYYHSTGCPACEVLERGFLAQVTNRLATVLDFRTLDVAESANFLRLMAVQERLGVDSEETLAVVVDDREALFGEPAIRARFEAVVEERRQTLPTEAGPSDGQRAAHPEEE